MTQKEYWPPNFVDSNGTDNYKAITGLDSTAEELHYVNPVIYAKAKFEQAKQNAQLLLRKEKMDKKLRDSHKKAIKAKESFTFSH